MELNPLKDQIPQQTSWGFFMSYFLFGDILHIFVIMKKLTFILVLSVMFTLGACGSKSTTNEQTDVEVVDGGGDGSVVSADGVEESDTETEVIE
jgi:hypothetical protein